MKHLVTYEYGPTGSDIVTEEYKFDLTEDATFGDFERLIKQRHPGRFPLIREIQPKHPKGSEYETQLEDAILKMSNLLWRNSYECGTRNVAYWYPTWCDITEHHDEVFVPLIREIKKRRGDGG